jgi:hypothetical protein
MSILVTNAMSEVTDVLGLDVAYVPYETRIDIGMK